MQSILPFFLTASLNISLQKRCWSFLLFVSRRKSLLFFLVSLFCENLSFSLPSCSFPLPLPGRRWVTTANGHLEARPMWSLIERQSVRVGSARDRPPLLGTAEPAMGRVSKRGVYVYNRGHGVSHEVGSVLSAGGRVVGDSDGRDEDIPKISQDDGFVSCRLRR